MADLLRFTKVHACGDDFIVYTDDAHRARVSTGRVVALCDRRTGVGASGLVRIVRSEHMPDAIPSLREDSRATWFVDYYRPDGAAGPVSATAVGVAACHLAACGEVAVSEGGIIPFATRSGIVDAHATGSSYSVDLGRWAPGNPASFRAGSVLGEADEFSTEGHRVRVAGQAVVVCATGSCGDPARPHPGGGPAREALRVLVDPASVAVADGIGRIRITGIQRAERACRADPAAAAAAALVGRGRMRGAAAHEWRVDTPGGSQPVRMFPTEDGEHIAVSGHVGIVFTGEVALRR